MLLIIIVLPVRRRLLHIATHMRGASAAPPATKPDKSLALLSSANKRRPTFFLHSFVVYIFSAGWLASSPSAKHVDANKNVRNDGSVC